MMRRLRMGLESLLVIDVESLVTFVSLYKTAKS